jgi:hypothetical protein
MENRGIYLFEFYSRCGIMARLIFQLSNGSRCLPNIPLSFPYEKLYEMTNRLINPNTIENLFLTTSDHFK